jgi:hypothetical protein
MSTPLQNGIAPPRGHDERRSTSATVAGSPESAVPFVIGAARSDARSEVVEPVPHAIDVATYAAAATYEAAPTRDVVDLIGA